MKKIYLVLVTVLFTVFYAEAQYELENVKMTYGEELPDDKAKLIKIIGEVNAKIYGLALKGKDTYYLKIFSSSDMKMISAKEIVLPELKDKDLEFEEVIMLNGKIYIIGSVYHRKDKVYTLVGIQLTEEGVLMSNMITLFESKVASNATKGGFYFKLNQDDSKFLIMHTSLIYKEDAMKYEIKLFDDKLAKIFENTDKVSFDESKRDYQFSISDFEVSYDNDVFLVVNEGYRDARAKEKIENFQVYAFKAKNAYKKEIVDIKVKDKEIINCSMMATNTGKLQLVGFYSSVRESGRANKELKGVYNATISIASLTNDNLKFNEFDYDTKVKLIGKRRADKGKDVKPLYHIHTIIERNDGGLIVLSEYRLVIVGQRSGIGPLGLQPITYITNEMIVTSLKPDGTLDWSNVVPKDQDATVTVASFDLFAVSGNDNFAVGVGLSFPLGVMGKGPEYLSAIPIYKDGNLMIIFNDNVKNKGITDIEKIKNLGNYNNAVPTVFVYDEKGNLTRKDPAEAIKNELVIRPGVFLRKNAKELIIYASRKKQDKLGRMFVD